MARASWIQHKGKKVFFIDFSNTDNKGVDATIAAAKPLISHEPKNSILCITDVTGTRVSKEISNSMKDFTMHNKPYMKMTAVIGIDGLQKVVYSLVLVFTSRKNLVLKNTKEEALEWLIGQ